jgi:membrane-anchored protein YejM (alkaline phosphatase superfamily)
LFYGIPANYYNKFKQHKIPALLFSRLKQLDYQINIFNGWYQDENNEITKFFLHNALIWNLSNNITRQYQKDQELTKAWLHWHSRIDKAKPWFSFVFYDSLHGPDFPEDYSQIAKPAIGLHDYKKFADKVGKQGFIKSYKTSVHYIDSLANKILQQLKDANDLDNTIVIITADHGCEWDDNNQGKWGYWSNFTDSQVKIPFAIILPKQLQHKLTTQEDKITTHYDIVPTLMHNFLGVANKITDYSIGNDLFSEFNNSSWSLATAIYPKKYYTEACFAIITKNQIIRVKPSSNYNFIDKFNNIIFSGKEIKFEYLNQSLEYMTRFIKK